MRWAPQADGGTSIVRYEYRLRDNGGWEDVGTATEETFRDLNGRFYIEVRAVNARGAGKAATGDTTVQEPEPEPEPEPTPTPTPTPTPEPTG